MALLATIGETAIGQLACADVTGAVARKGTVTFPVASRSSDSADSASMEDPVARRRILVIKDIAACIPPASTPTALTACDRDLATGSAGDVTDELVHAAGVTVTQLTANDNKWSMITYYDVPAAIAGSNRFVYSRVRTRAGNYAAAMTLDGDDPKLITDSPESGGNIFLTPNGAMAYFPRKNARTRRIDINAVDLSGSTCTESMIVQNLPLPTDADSIMQLSTASRSCTADAWVIAVATENRIHRYKGKTAGEGLWAPMGSFVLGDDLSMQKFHRLRLSPACPNILMYSRDRANGRSDKDIYLTDLDRQPEVPYFLSFGQKAWDAGITPFRRVPSHEMWSNDGLSVSYIQSTEDQFEPRKLVIGNILNPDCTFRTTNPDGSSNLEGTSGIAGRTFKGNVVYHKGDAASYVPKFCSWSADDQHFACSGYHYSRDCNGDFIEDKSAIFLLNPATGATRFLSMTHELPPPDPSPCQSRDPYLEPYADPYAGQSHVQFAGNKTTILFDSDRLVGTTRLTGQVYKLSYPASMLP